MAVERFTGLFFADMNTKQKLELLANELVAGYQVWLARRVGKLVRLPAKARPVALRVVPLPYVSAVKGWSV